MIRPMTVISAPANEITKKLNPLLNKTPPSQAPTAFATLKADAALVAARVGASFAPVIIFVCKIGIVPKAPNPNKKTMISALIGFRSEERRVGKEGRRQ